jgi:hypothetical protein
MALCNNKENVENVIDKLSIIQQQKIVQNIPLSDELKAISQLNIDKLIDKNFNNNISSIIKDLEGDFKPKIVIKNESK